MSAPFQQGDLDGLCAIYACINAAKLITGRLGLKKGRQLFLESALALAEKKQSISYITEGTNTIDLARILRDIICPEFNLERSKPFHKRSHVPTNEFWEVVQDYLKPGSARSVLIIIETWEYCHWTVISEITPSQISLYDSTHRKIINRRLLSTIDLTDATPILVHPTSTYFLQQR